MIISFLNQKGGVGKSTLARGTAVEYIKGGWDVHVADLDTTQLTSLQWAQDRKKAGIKPYIDIATYTSPQSALKSASRCNLLIIDGTPFATTETVFIAQKSDLVVVPTGVTKDDLHPSLRMANELNLKSGIAKDKIIFVIMKVPEGGDKEVKSTRASIKEWGFPVIDGWIPLKVGYGKAMDGGHTMAETRYSSLNKKASKIVSGIASQAQQIMEAV